MTTRTRRLWRHLFTDRGDVRRTIPPAGLALVEHAIAEGERAHAGQVCVAVEAALPLTRVWSGVTPRERAIEVFALLRVWDTEFNDGVLVYLLLADHDVEIVADRGIDARVGAQAWEAICKAMEEAFRARRFTEGLVDGVAAISTLLAQHSPRGAAERNELSDQPIIL